MVIRELASEFHPLLMPLLYKMHSESGLSLPPLDEAKCLKSLGNSIVLVSEENQEITGMLALQIGEHWFSREKFIGDLVFYVDSDWRASQYAIKLLQKAKERATIEGLPLLLGVVDGKDVERKDMFYVRQGFKKAGGIYMWAPK
jgi:GNAT superfamily N-acetyltransferase